MNRLEIDWTYLRLASRVLAKYILLPEIYWPLTPVKGIPAAGGLSQLSIGNILLSLQRLQAISVSDSEQTDLAELCHQIEQVRNRWRANWERKARRERSDRQNLWQIYINELITDTKLFSRSYPAQSRLRTIIHLLSEEIGTQAIGFDEGLDPLDNLLKSISSPGPFVWEAELAAGFPENTCWFLYRTFA